MISAYYKCVEKEEYISHLERERGRRLKGSVKACLWKVALEQYFRTCPEGFAWTSEKVGNNGQFR